MAATNKVATPLLVSPHTRDRITALAIVRKERLAEVTRAALEAGGLDGLEKTHAEALSTLHGSINQRMNAGEVAGDKSAVLKHYFETGTAA